MPLYHEKGLTGNRSLRCYHIPSSAALEYLFYFTHSGHFYVNRDYRIERTDGMLTEPYMLMYTVSGMMYLEQEGRVYCAGEGEILLFECRKAHAYYSDRHSIYQFLLFGGNISAYYYNRLCRNGQHLIQPVNARSILQCLSGIIQETEKALPEEHLISAQIHHLLGMLITHRETDASLNMERIRTVIQYMQEHINEPVSMKTLADQVNLHEQYLSRIFREYTEISPYEYLLNLRVIRAKQLLITTSDSISEIGERCGFRDTSHFIKTFKKKVLSTPLAYRKMNRC